MGGRGGKVEKKKQKNQGEAQSRNPKVEKTPELQEVVIEALLTIWIHRLGKILIVLLSHRTSL